MSWDDYARQIREFDEIKRRWMGTPEALLTSSSIALEPARNIDARSHADDVPAELREQVLAAGRPTISRVIRPLALHELY